MRKESCLYKYFESGSDFFTLVVFYCYDAPPSPMFRIDIGEDAVFDMCYKKVPTYDKSPKVFLHLNRQREGHGICNQRSKEDTSIKRHDRPHPFTILLSRSLNVI